MTRRMKPPRGPSQKRLHMLKLFRALSCLGSVLLAAASSSPQAQPPQANLIHVDIIGLRSESGQVLCALYSSPVGFPKNSDKAVRRAKSEISHGHAICEFSGIAVGKYAVSVFHDENSNGKLDSNFLGIPREGVGASNNAKGHFGPPKFDAAAVQFAGGRLDLKITIAYL